MKKKLVALLISATMISASMAVPVYAEDESISVEVTDEEEPELEVEESEEQQEEDDTSVDEDFSDETTEDFSDQNAEEIFSAGSESVDTRTTVGGNINWGSSNSILQTDVTTAKNDRTFLGIRGSYITDMQNALDRINAIRKEACNEGIKDPRDESRNLTSSDYVPIKWSSDLEYIARIRAAEASVYRQHTRLNGYECSAISSPNGIRSFGEVLAWNNTKKFLQGVEQWYREKAAWVGNTDGVTGHYTQMIDPDNIYVGLATFVNANARYSTTTAGEFTSQKNLDYSLGTSQTVLDESAGPAIDNCIQTVEVKNAKIVASMTELTGPLAAKNSIQAEFTLTGYGWKMEPLNKVSWTSSDTKTANVDSEGKVTGVHEGTADITASYGNFTVTKNVQVTGHPNVELKNAKEATCSEEGYTGDKSCKDCGVTVETGKTISKKEHSWDSGKITIHATCTETGEKTYTCQACRATKTETVPAVGHTVVIDSAVAATCESAGKTEGRHCSVCDKVLTEQKTVKATGHNWDEGKITQEATCEKSGVKTYTCKICKKTKTEKINALGHKIVTDPAVAATCEDDGKTEGRHCSVCDKVLIEQKTVKATGHNWDEGKITQEATCEKSGVKTYTCKTCKKTKTEKINALGHKIVTDPAVAATCEKDGKTEGSHCSVCSKVFVEQDVIPATGHTPVTDPAVAATCEDDGKTEGSHCAVCSKILTEQKIIKATGHNWDEGKITKEASCERPGEIIYTCGNCQKTKKEDIKAVGHKFDAWQTTSQADVFSPIIQTRVCSVCGKSEQKTVGNKLQKTITVTLSSIPLKRKQKTNVLKVSGLAKGDSIVSWKSSNPKIVNVKGNANGTSILTAGKKTGKAKIVITLKSGLQKTVTVSVQKSAVKTKKISGVAKTLKLKKKQKAALRPMITPLTSTEKITYKSSNAKVVTVNSKGKIVAKKKGTAVITIRSGKKTVKCKVTVK